MTDNEIIKALECCERFEIEDCKECPYYTLGHGCLTKCFGNALALIKRQKAEIERLESYNENLLAANVGLSCGLLDEIKTARAEAIKEFAEKLKRNTVTMQTVEGYSYNAITRAGIDFFEKQMTEGV